MTTTPPTRTAAGAVAPGPSLGTRAAAGDLGCRSDTQLRRVAACATVTVDRARRAAAGERRYEGPCRRACAGDRLRCPLTGRAERRRRAPKGRPRPGLSSTPGGSSRRSARSAPRGCPWAGGRRCRASRGARDRRSRHGLRPRCRPRPSSLGRPRPMSRPLSRPAALRRLRRRRHSRRAAPVPPASAPLLMVEANRRQEVHRRPRPRKPPAPREARARARVASATGGRARREPQRSTAGRRRPQWGQSLRSFWTSCSREQPHRRRFSTL